MALCLPACGSSYFLPGSHVSAGKLSFYMFLCFEIKIWASLESKPQPCELKESCLISNSLKLNAQHYHRQSEGKLLQCRQTCWPTYPGAPAGERLNKLFTRPLECFKGHVCYCLWKKIHTPCSEIKHPECLWLYQSACQYAVGVGKIWKPKMRDWCSVACE